MSNEAMDALLRGDEVAGVLEERFYSDAPPKPALAPAAEPKKAKKKRRKRKPAADVDYKVICISLYDEDLARLDAKVAELKKSGHRKMSRSALIRFALDHVDLEALPKAY